MKQTAFYRRLISSKSGMAVILRLLAWGLLGAAILVGVMESISDAEPMPLLIYSVQAAAVMLLLYTVAAILHYLAEITDALKNKAERDTDGH